MSYENTLEQHNSFIEWWDGASSDELVIIELTHRYPPPVKFSAIQERCRTDDIRIRAYFLWEAAGKPFGQDGHFWSVAEREYEQARRKAADTEYDHDDFTGYDGLRNVYPHFDS